MIKVLFLVRKRPDLTAEQFRRYWVETHAPIASTMPGLRRYTLNPALADPSQSPPTYDGVAELWFDSPAAFEAALASPGGQATLADVPNFLIPNDIRVLVAEEVPVTIAAVATS
jgi:uncharacterized protein (TIGR02118 family)